MRSAQSGVSIGQRNNVHGVAQRSFSVRLKCVNDRIKKSDMAQATLIALIANRKLLDDEKKKIIR